MNYSGGQQYMALQFVVVYKSIVQISSAIYVT